MSSGRNSSPSKRWNSPQPDISSQTPKTPSLSHTEALKALDIYARTTLQTLRTGQLEYVNIYKKIEEHEPANPEVASIYRALALDPIRAVGHEEYQNCCIAIPIIQRDLRAVLKTFEEKREYVLAMVKSVGDFEDKFRKEVAAEGEVYRKLRAEGKEQEMEFVVTGRPGELVRGRFMRVKGVVEDIMVKLEMMLLGERVVVRRFGRLARLVLALPGAQEDHPGSRGNADSVDEEVEKLMGQLTGILGHEMEIVD
ncbi:hypothetical protein L873DRAFT_1809617 [Choiromyces venosus 120613-1]|uniref:Uncharacterized protein n=1 Tax=Choiromyces venosus 120613-1 TaxID=1336337 RepID=A0A3N4JKP2_9PEZI|nr:hypothetical protein L873DRAFT_1809617 [Choiromyces venosus 120613-1]